MTQTFAHKRCSVSL